ncbi:MAG: Lrp/AsnC family transcriptional regulator [Planctomycetota bacterium]
MPDPTDAALLVALQRGLPLVERPFAAVGDALGHAEAEVLQRIEAWLRDGTARRVGGIFRSHALGYASLLCAVDADADRLDGLAAIVNRHPGVTHNYAREGRPALWFTLLAPASRLEAEADGLEQALGCAVIRLPATLRFKTRVILDPAAGRAAADSPARSVSDRQLACPGRPEAGPVLPLGDTDRNIIRRLQEPLPLVPAPFAAVAEAAGCGEADLLERLRRWADAGVLSRVALVPHHRRLGFGGNAMCVWDPNPDVLPAAGAALAARPEVTHCYARRRDPRFPFSLYAMIHGRTAADAHAGFAALSTLVPAGPGRCLLSTREYKKTSPRYFVGDEAG